MSGKSRRKEDNFIDRRKHIKICAQRILYPMGRMKARAYLIVAAALAAAVLLFGWTKTSAETTERELLSRTVATVDGEEVDVYLYGTRAVAGGYAFCDFTLEYGSVSVPIEGCGYGATVSAFDFLGDGNEQIFFAASTGGSGGYGYYYVFGLGKDGVTTLFDHNDFVNEYSAQRECDGGVAIFREGEKVLTFEPRTDGEKLNEPEVGGVNFVAPSYFYPENRYRLDVWQKVTDSAAYDVVGHIVTLIDLAGESGEFTAVSFR